MFFSDFDGRAERSILTIRDPRFLAGLCAENGCKFDEDGAAVRDLVRLGLAVWEEGMEAAGGEAMALRGVSPAPALERLRSHWIDMFPSH